MEDTSCWRGAQEEEEWGARNCLGSKNMTHTSCKTFQGPPTLPGEGQRVTRDLQILIRKHNHNNKGTSCVAPPPPGEVRLTPQVGLSDLFQVPNRQLLASLLGAARRRFVAQRKEPFFLTGHRTGHSAPGRGNEAAKGGFPMLPTSQGVRTTHRCDTQPLVDVWQLQARTGGVTFFQPLLTPPQSGISTVLASQGGSNLKDDEIWAKPKAPFSLICA